MFWEWFKFAKSRGLEKDFMKESMRGNYDSVAKKLYRISDFEFKRGLQSATEAIENLEWKRFVFDLGLSDRR